ncbi:MAG: endopeptidase La [Natronospirillum sp.]
MTESTETRPVLPLRDVVVYPHMVIPLFVGRERSISALSAAMEADKKIILVAQRHASEDEPQASDLFQIGTLASVLQLLKLPDGTVKVLVEGVNRIRLNDVDFDHDDYIVAEYTDLPEADMSEREEQALLRTLNSQFEKYVQLSKKVPSEVLTSLESIDEPSRLIDTIAAHMSLKLEEKQDVLEMPDIRERIEHVLGLLETEIDLLQVEKRIRSRVKKQMEKSQREYYLNEQMKAIQKELGDMDDSHNELEVLQKKVEEAGMPTEALDKATNELKKLKMMSPMSAEASVVRGYIEWLLTIPWKKRTRSTIDLPKAQEILDEDHYGLEEVKERILEFLAVQKRVKKIKGPILCLVGPPGVGKTSLGRSIARAVNRKYVRMALGGVRDEAEIRGHRRTYIGSLPGKVIQKMSKVGVKNPLFLLDEIDKMGMDQRGDPASALLEVLDPEQNNSFNDHYLELDYDLSDVLFICTSNSMNIPGPLLDRMEVIRLPGYTEQEKTSIARNYLVSKQLKSNGLKPSEVVLPDDTLKNIVRNYTKEAGVRGLEREIAKICRKAVRRILEQKEDNGPLEVKPDQLEDFLGVIKYRYGLAEEDNQIGQVTGLAWTSVGGELLTLESAVTPGRGRLNRTGKLGDVMQESIQTAVTVVRSRSQALGILPSMFERQDIHIHVPEGATPKDGPSAGIGMCVALVSAMTRIPVRAEVAMTGEITLRGQVLAIGGLKEKLLAAHRGGLKTIIIPEENERDLKEVPENILADLDIKPVKWIDEVLSIALVGTPEPLTDAQIEADLKPQRDWSRAEGERPSTH